MKTKAARLYGANDARLEEFELRPITSGEILIKIISDSVCMSTHKTIMQGKNHLRVPDNAAENPIILGHEFCGEVVEVGDKWKDKFSVGDKVVMPPVLAYLGGPETVGYTFCDIGGVSTYSIVYEHILDNDFLMKLESDSYFKGSLIEPASCVIRGYKASLHLDENLTPVTGIKKGGKVAILAGCGPMGLVAIDTTINLPNIPGGKKLIYTHINLPLTALSEFEKLGATDERFKTLDEIVKAHNGLWCTEAEKYLLGNF